MHSGQSANSNSKKKEFATQLKDEGMHEIDEEEDSSINNLPTKAGN